MLSPTSGGPSIDAGLENTAGVELYEMLESLLECPIDRLLPSDDGGWSPFAAEGWPLSAGERDEMEWEVLLRLSPARSVGDSSGSSNECVSVVGGAVCGLVLYASEDDDEPDMLSRRCRGACPRDDDSALGPPPTEPGGAPVGGEASLLLEADGLSELAEVGNDESESRFRWRGVTVLGPARAEEVSMAAAMGGVGLVYVLLRCECWDERSSVVVCALAFGRSTSEPVPNALENVAKSERPGREVLVVS